MNHPSSSQSVARREVIALEPREGESIWFLDNLLTVKVSAKDGAPYGLVDATLPAGSQTPFHRHHGEDEAFFVVEGELTIFVEKPNGDIGRILGCPGSYVHIPRGVAHGFRTETALRMIVLTGLDGFVEFAREAGMPAPRHELPPLAPPDLAKLGAAAANHRIDLLGPLPETLRG